MISFFVVARVLAGGGDSMGRPSTGFVGSSSSLGGLATGIFVDVDVEVDVVETGGVELVG